MRDTLYEQELHKHQKTMLMVLDEYRQDPAEWLLKDFLAVQRALQVLIESHIGLARYIVEQQFTIKLAKSREAIDELKNRQLLSPSDHNVLIKMIGFRNILVHDYLDINSDIVLAVVKKGDYKNAQAIIDKLWDTALKS